MTDIVIRLRTEGAMKDYYDAPALQRDAASEIERLRTCVKTLTGQLQYIGDIATATAENTKRWKETK